MTGAEAGRWVILNNFINRSENAPQPGGEKGIYVIKL